MYACNDLCRFPSPSCIYFHIHPNIHIFNGVVWMGSSLNKLILWSLHCNLIVCPLEALRQFPDWFRSGCMYSTPDLVPDRTEELNARPFAEKKVSCLKQSFSIFHYLCSGISVFVQRRNLGTTGAEQPSPCLRSPKVGELLTLSPVWALDFPAQLISYLSIWKKSYFCRRVHYKQPPQQPRIMSDTLTCTWTLTWWSAQGSLARPPARPSSSGRRTRNSASPGILIIFNSFLIFNF